MTSIKTMPVLFVGHGSPMNAIENNEFSNSWVELSNKIPTPKAIVVISAHWETQGTEVTNMGNPKTIHDFFGFPQELNEIQYRAPGSPYLAEEIKQLCKIGVVTLNSDWGLDHGSWSVLTKMYPQANIPVVQFSLNQDISPREHFELAKSLLKLRQEDILIIGSGNLVHNLGILNWKDEPYDWAVDFDIKVKELIDNRDFEALIDYPNLKYHELAIPTNEHYLPLLYILALLTKDDKIEYFNEKISLGSLSMRSIYTS
jgi:4,5-DOPA dioxygenase extradiol